jgi:hypothetical protein
MKKPRAAPNETAPKKIKVKFNGEKPIVTIFIFLSSKKSPPGSG